MNDAISGASREGLDVCLPCYYANTFSRKPRFPAPSDIPRFQLGRRLTRAWVGCTRMLSAVDADEQAVASQATA